MAVATGTGTSQSFETIVSQGGVMWGGKLYATPSTLRSALGLTSADAWNAWLQSHGTVLQWVNWRNAGSPPLPPAGTTAPPPAGTTTTGGDTGGSLGGGDPSAWQLKRARAIAGKARTDRTAEEQAWLVQFQAAFGPVSSYAGTADQGGGTGAPAGGGVPPPPGEEPPLEDGLPPEALPGTEPPRGAADYSGLLGMAGLPADLIAQINSIFQTVVDPSQAQAMALGIVRGSAWYQTEFPGINLGLKSGIFTDERGYRSYRNSLQEVYRQWGVDFSSGALMAALTEGTSPDVVNRRFQAQAYVAANRPDLLFLSGAAGDPRAGGSQFSEAEMLALGQERAGLGTPGGLGMKVDRMLGLASQRMQRMFEGVAGNPQLALTQRGSIFAPSLSPGSDVDIPA